jgi:hypothetical protein
MSTEAEIINTEDEAKTKLRERCERLNSVVINGPYKAKPSSEHWRVLVERTYPNFSVVGQYTVQEYWWYDWTIKRWKLDKRKRG